MPDSKCCLQADGRHKEEANQEQWSKLELNDKELGRSKGNQQGAVYR
jgi:hypothetical protein